MLKKHLHTISVSLLAGLMLFTALGFNLSMHYCFGRLKAVSLYEQTNSCFNTFATRCGWEAPEATNYPTFAEAPPPCCEDESYTLFLDEDYQQVEVTTFQSLEIDFLSEAPLSTYHSSFELYKGQRAYTPPLPEVDIPVFVQSFRL
ncbi:MAG: hypothetical protein AAFR66_25305 [Bacteroidota bacterium]